MTVRAAAERRRVAVRTPGRTDERGLVTLEWILVLGAIAGIAAVSVLAVEGVVESEVERPPDPAARLVEADVVAAVVVHEALELVMAGSDVTDVYESVFRARCLNIGVRFADVVESAEPEPNLDWTPAYLHGVDENGVDVSRETRRGPFQCRLTPHALSP